MQGPLIVSYTESPVSWQQNSSAFSLRASTKSASWSFHLMKDNTSCSHFSPPHNVMMQKKSFTLSLLHMPGPHACDHLPTTSQNKPRSFGEDCPIPHSGIMIWFSEPCFIISIYTSSSLWLLLDFMVILVSTRNIVSSDFKPPCSPDW